MHWFTGNIYTVFSVRWKETGTGQNFQYGPFDVRKGGKNQNVFFGVHGKKWKEKQNTIESGTYYGYFFLIFKKHIYWFIICE